MKGFTIFEILLVLIFISFLFYLGLLSIVPFYYSYILENEKILILNILHNARIDALNNLYSLPRGVYFDSDKYILFSGNDFFSRNRSYDIVYPRSLNIEINTPQNPIIFSNLSATTSANGTIVLKLFNKEKRIIINNEALLDFE